VNFFIDGQLAQPAATLTSGVATMTNNFAVGGAHTVQAVYSDGTGFFVSSSPGGDHGECDRLRVAKTTTTLTASPTIVALSGSLQLTASGQNATAGTVAGDVTFSIGGTTIGTAAITPGASGWGGQRLRCHLTLD
jgi:hypothetical protein